MQQQTLFEVERSRQQKPENEQLYVIAVMFNPRNAEARYRLWHEFMPYMDFSGAKVIAVEAAFADRPHECTDANNPWHVQLRTDQDLWHKEKMINIGIQRLLHLVPDAKYIAWIDADVRFSNPHWVRDTVRALHHYTVVQLFSEAQNLNPKYERMWSCPSAFKQYESKGYHQNPPKTLEYIGNGHPGLAWAARRDFLTAAGGLIDFCIAGSGDTHMANALRGDIGFNFREGMSPGFRRALERWAEKAHAACKGNIGYVNGICMHYWHGKSNIKGYEKRWDIVCFMQFDPHEDIYADINGLYKYAGNKEHLSLDLRRSLIEREDE